MEEHTSDGPTAEVTLGTYVIHYRIVLILHTWWPAQLYPLVGYHPFHQEHGWCPGSVAPRTVGTANGRSSAETFLHDGPHVAFPEEEIKRVYKIKKHLQSCLLHTGPNI